jgi:hypothetical protein
VDIDTVLGCVVGHEEECFKTIEQGTESVKLASLLELWLNLIQIISQEFHTIIFYFALEHGPCPGGLDGGLV